MMTIIETALQIALTAHKGQADKGGQAYILHPLRVMQGVNSMDEKVVAILHDVVEDSIFTFKDLEKEGIPTHCIEALKLLTHVKDVSYMDYIRKIATNPLAKSVKLADLRDNTDTSRLKQITDKDEERLNKYRKAIHFLNQ